MTIFSWLFSFPFVRKSLKGGHFLIKKILSFLPCLLFFYFIKTLNAHAIPENELDSLLGLINQNREKKSFFKSFFFSGEKEFKIHFLKYGFDRGKNGSVLISPGRGEAALKYSELAYDLMQKGFSPVFAIDHRGQGDSDRAFKNPYKGHVFDFRFYYRDFHKWTERILRDKDVNKENLFLISHSMGSTIAIEYLQNFSSTHPFKKVLLSAPMIKIKSGISEHFSLLLTFLVCYFPLTKYMTKLDCNNYIFGGHGYDPNEDEFENNVLTSSQSRFSFNKKLWNTNSSAFLGSPTFRWFRESIKATRRIRLSKKVKKIEPTPVLVLQAGQDKIVDNRAQRDFCRGLFSCKLISIKESKHEILMERDELRDQALQAMLSFFGEKTLDKNLAKDRVLR